MAIAFSIGEATRTIEIVARRPRLVVKIDGIAYEVEEAAGVGSRHRLRVDGEAIEFAAAFDAEACFVRLKGRTWRISAAGGGGAIRSDKGGADEIRAPMPGVVVSIDRKPGELVQRGETVVTIESMKLQSALGAPRDGVVAGVFKQANESFDKDEVIATIAPVNAAD